MQILETHAKNTKEALDLSAEFLQVDSDLIDVELHQKGAGGFLGFGSKNPSVYLVNSIEEKTPLNTVIKGVISTILIKMGYQAKILRIEEIENDKLYVELASPQAGFIIGKRGKTLENLQFAVNLMVEKFDKNAPRILLDIENYRDKRAKYLESLALKLAATVIKYKKSKILDPLNPYERRLVHMALQDHDKVETSSDGNGIYKRVRIFLKAKPKSQKSKQSSNQQKKKNPINENETTENEISEEEIIKNLNNDVVVDEISSHQENYAAENL